MDTASVHQWPQEFMIKPMEEEEEMLANRCTKQGGSGGERRPRPPKEQTLNCPRCNSTNTKFCYYNNYSLTQPRYFCKTCRRYWTEGGSLRNIPVGGGSRKNKRSICSSSPSPPTMLSSVSPTKQLAPPPDLHHQNHKFLHEGHDLNLGFSSSHGYGSMCEFLQIPPSIDQVNNNNNNKNPVTSSSSTSGTHHISALELLTGITSKGMNSFSAPSSVAATENNGASVFANGFPMQEFKPTLNFCVDGFGGGGYGDVVDESPDSSRRLLFHFEDHFKQAPSSGSGHVQQQQQQQQQSREQHHETAGYWTGMLGGGPW